MICNHEELALRLRATDLSVAGVDGLLADLVQRRGTTDGYMVLHVTPDCPLRPMLQDILDDLLVGIDVRQALSITVSIEAVAELMADVVQDVDADKRREIIQTLYRPADGVLVMIAHGRGVSIGFAAYEHYSHLPRGQA